jgi:peptidyl-prolyl cis-trans isomerase C
MRFTLTSITLALLCLTTAPVFGQQPTADGDEGAVMPQVDPTTEPVTSTTAAPNPIVLRVNGEPIHAFEISMVMQTIQTQLQALGEEVDQREIAQVATQRTIEQVLLVQEARRFGIEPDELQVARAAKMAEEQSGGRASLEAKLKNTGSSYDEFLDIIREIETMKAYINQQIKPNVEVTEQDIADYYAANPELFDADERVHAYHMIFIVGEDAAPDVLAAARQQAEAARTRVVKGDADFMAVAKELSQGPSAPTGGDLGWVTRGQLVQPLSDAVFSLEPGEVSEVVQSRFGFHVATITDHRPAEKISLDEASGQIEAFLRQEEATKAVGDLLQTLVENAQIENLLAGPPVGS